MIDWSAVAVRAAARNTHDTVEAANTNAGPERGTATALSDRPASWPSATVQVNRVPDPCPQPQAANQGAAAAPVPSFFLLFEDHGLDGLIPDDWDEATRLWLGR